MAKIHLSIDTNENETLGRKWGSWTLTVIAGLDEPAGKILDEAADRLKIAVSALPKEKRYSRYTAEAVIDSD